MKPFKDGVPVVGLCKANKQADQQSSRWNDRAPGNSIEGKFDDLRHTFDIPAHHSETISPARPRCVRSRRDEAVEPEYRGGENGGGDKYHDHRQPDSGES